MTRPAYLFPVPAKPLRSLLDAKAKRGEEFRDDEAALDVMLALDRDDLRPLRYLAARWGWSKNRVHRGLDDLKATSADWRSFYAGSPSPSLGQAGTDLGQDGTKTGFPDLVIPGPGTRVGQAGTDLGQYRTDPDLKPQKTNTPPAPQGGSGRGGGGASRFEDFWAAYPKKRGKKAAEKKWRAKRLDRIADDLVADVEARAARDHRWTKDDGRFIPDPTTYLNQERWHDEYEPTPRPVATDDARNRPVETYLNAGNAALAALRSR